MTTESSRLESRRLSRRRFIQAGAAVGIGAVAAGYVKPSISSLGVPKAFASSSPIPQMCHGLTPGYWKNWANHYTPEQSAAICANSIAPTPGDVDTIFEDYNESPGYELTMLRAFVLCNQLTVFITYNAGFPNPSQGYLTSAWEIDGRPVGDCLQEGLDMLAMYTPTDMGCTTEHRPMCIQIKDCLDAFANLS